MGLSMSAIYAAIITKTNRLARVFSPQSAQRPGCITPKAQVGNESGKIKGSSGCYLHGNSLFSTGRFVPLVDC